MLLPSQTLEIEGPRTFKRQKHPLIASVMKNLASKTISEIVSKDYRTSALFTAREELILFPYIQKMTPDEKGLRKFDAVHFDGVRSAILGMMRDHESEGDRSQQIKLITKDFRSARDADDNYKIAMGLLRDFDHNLRKHLHLENNILFPKALQSGKKRELVHD